MSQLLLVSNDSTKTGAPLQVFLLAKELKGRYQISACCPLGWLHDKFTSLGIPVEDWPEGRLPSQLAVMKKIYQKIRPDMVHCHGLRAGVVCRLCDRPSQTKVIYTEHLWTNDFHLPSWIREKIQHQLLRQAARRSDWVIAVSQAVANFLINKRGTDTRRTSVIYGAIIPLTKGRPRPGHRIGTLGSLTFVKGIPTLLQAAALLTDRFPDLEVIIGGDGPDRAMLQQLAGNLGLTERCQWLGQVSSLEDFYPQLTVYVQPSLSESFGLAAGEAMSIGLPVVVSRVGGLPELIGQSEAGFFFPPNNAAVLADHLALLLSDRGLYQKMSRAAKLQASQFSIKRFIDEHISLYEKVLHEPKS